MIDILALSGSLRAASTNSVLLAAVQRHAPPDCRLTVDGGLGRLPIFNPDDEADRAPSDARVLIDAVTASDGVVVSSPEYAHGVPGGLKNALDWLVSRDAAVGKPAMLVHASPRSLISRAALGEIMRTMSFDLYDGPELEIALLGKKPGQVEGMLTEPSNIALMRNALSGFASFVQNR